MAGFDKILQESLNQLDVSAPPSRVMALREVQDDIKLVEKRLHELRLKLQHCQEELNTALALELRKRIPGLNVSLNGGNCTINYRSRYLVCRPDVMAGAWKFEPNDEGRRFSRGNGHLLGLTDDLSPLSSAIAEFFTQRYKTLSPDRPNA